MTLAGWNTNNITRLEIDHTNIDEDLTNFPLLVKLNGAAGLNSTSCSGVIDSLRGEIITTVSGIDTRDSYVKFLLQSDTEVDGSQVMIDSSSSGHSITVYGDTQHQLAQKKFGSSSIYFDGTADMLYTGASDDFSMGTGNFTIDCWYRPTSKARNYPVIWELGNGWTTNVVYFAERHDSWPTKFVVVSYNYSPTVRLLESTTTVSNGTWYHLAVVRSGNNWYLFVNGTLEDSAVDTNTVNTTAKVLNIGMQSTSTGVTALNGHIDELRVSKGIARWTTSFTPPTETYYRKGITSDERDSYTKLLIQSNTTYNVTSKHFYDSSYSQHTLTAGGDVVHSTGAYRHNGSSIYFDGNGDYLSVATDPDFNFGGDDFTIDFYMYATASSDERDGLIVLSSGSNVPIHIGLGGSATVWSTGGDKLALSLNYTGTWGSETLGTASVCDSTWHHIALVKSGTAWKVYVDGSLDIDATYSYSPPESSVLIGAHITTDRWFSGYLDEIRISKGIARWATIFYPPELAYYTPNATYPKRIAFVQPAVQEHWVSQSDVKLLVHSNTTQGSVTFTDSSDSIHSIVANGDVKHSTVQKKFGSSSIYFDGTGDYLSIINSPDWGLFIYTIDFWFYTGYAGGAACMVNTGNANNATDFQLEMGRTTGKIGLYSVSQRLISTNTWNDSTWHHLALVCDGTNTVLYIDGTLEGTAAGFAPIFAPTSGLYIGASYATTAPWEGYIDELRIIKGRAAWTSAFSVPTIEHNTNDYFMTETIPGGDTQLYCEIDNWELTPYESYLWVKVPKIFSDQPTDILMYYDQTHADNSTYVGNTGETAAKNVWNSSYVAVFHGTQNPEEGTNAVKDSTSNELHGTRQGTGVSRIKGDYSWALDFTPSDYVLCGTALDVWDDGMTIEVVVYPDDATADCILCYGNAANYGTVEMLTNSWCLLSSYTGAGWTCNLSTPACSAVTWQYRAGRYNGTTADAILWKDYTLSVTTDSSEGQPNMTDNLIKLGIDRSVSTYPLDGKLAEIRFSKTDLSDAWIKATYYSYLDNLITYDLSPGLYKVDGYVTELDTPVQRLVCLYNRASGELMNKTMSDESGYYHLTTTNSGTHNLVCFDAEGGGDYNDILVSKVYPTEAI